MAPTLIERPGVGRTAEVELVSEYGDGARVGEAALALPVKRDGPDDVGVRVPPRDRRRAERTVLLVIAAAGAVGALARYAMSRVIAVPAGHFVWSTFWTNVSGSLAIGFVLALVIERFPRARLVRPLIATGFLGAYTTFSTYTVDADLLFRSRDVATGALYALASLVAGLAAAFVGIVLARLATRVDHRLGEGLR